MTCKSPARSVDMPFGLQNSSCNRIHGNLRYVPNGNTATGGGFFICNLSVGK